MEMFAPHNLDFYKVLHKEQYPEGTEEVYSNFTARSGKHSNVPGSRGVVFIGLQLFIVDVLIQEWNNTFFLKDKEDVLSMYRRRMELALQRKVDIQPLADLHDLGYLPVKIKALPEGMVVPYGVPMFTIRSTNKKFAWVTNMLETVISSEMWQMINSATTYVAYRNTFRKYALLTCDNSNHVPFQGHDFSMRGMVGREAAAKSGFAVLACGSYGTDTVTALDVAEQFYAAPFNKHLGGSIPATEHSVMCAGSKEGEIETFERLLFKVYPKGPLSIVSDTWDLWKVVDEFLPKLRTRIMQREGKLVIRPDCYDDKTSILTNNGWQLFSELSKEDLVAQVLDDGSYEFVEPHSYIEQEYEGDMVSFKDHHGKVNLLVTPNHRMILLNRKNNSWKVDEAITRYKPDGKMVGGSYNIAFQRAAAAKGAVSKLSNYHRLNIAFQADGSYVSNSTRKIRFHLVKQRKLDRIVSLVEDMSLPYVIYDISSGGQEIHIDVGDSHDYYKTFDWVHTDILSKEWCIQFIEELAHWDATVRNEGRVKFDTTTKEVMDVVELVAISAGYGCLLSKSVDDRSEKFNDVYTAHIMKDSLISTQAIKTELIRYKGKVFCVKVPSGRLLVKRDRGSVVCGNSGDPVDIICGDSLTKGTTNLDSKQKGLIERLWEIFGGTTNTKGYKVLHPCIGAIYGESITLVNQEQMLSRLQKKGFASSNIVMGIGSHSFQYNTRDTHGIAIKATSVTINGTRHDIFKDPITDSGLKKSAKGYLQVYVNKLGTYELKQECTAEEENEGELRTVFEDGVLTSSTTLSEIRRWTDEATVN